MPTLKNANGHFAMRELADRFWEKVIKTDSCWFWVGKSDNRGYGRIRVGDKMPMAHQVSYYLKFNEWIPLGYEPDHTCKEPSCVRWGFGHLEAITREEHLRRTSLTHRNRVKTECIRGHSNWRYRKNGSRYCIDCTHLRNIGRI